MCPAVLHPTLTTLVGTQALTSKGAIVQNNKRMKLGKQCKYRESEEAIKDQNHIFSLLLCMFLISFIPSMSNY